jgi:hypothetical protein
MKNMIVIMLTLAAISVLSLPGYTAMTVDWVVDSSASDIVLRDTMRDIAYNPVTGHLLLVECLGEATTQRGVWILDSNSGATIGRLQDPTDQPDGWGTGTQISPYGICCDANGVIYVQRYFYTNNNEILRYADETSSPTIAATSDATYVRSLNVVGTGNSTLISFPCQIDEQVRIYGTSDGLTFGEYYKFTATDAVHDAVSNTAADTVYIARGYTTGYYTHKWYSSGGMWSEDAGWNKEQYIINITLDEKNNVLYGAYWNLDTVGANEGIRAWNALTGAQIDSLDIGDSGTVSVRGCYLSNIADFSTVDVAQDAENITIGETKQLNVTANLARKIYFIVCGGIGYGRVDLGAVVTGPVWSSNNYSVASVDGTGLVSAISVGVCTVSATYTKDGSPYADSAVITVVATNAPLAPDVVSNNKVHRIEPVGEISVPRVIRSWELFQ